MDEERIAKTRMIDSAVKLFSEFGVDNVSLRELTKHAEVNLAAVNYHFGSKDALAETVFEELAKRINGRRKSALKKLVSEGTLRVEDIVETFMAPYTRPNDNDNDEGLLLAQFVLKHRVAPSPMTRRLTRKYFDPIAKQYIDALAKACPDVPKAQLLWRYVFMVNTLVLTVTDLSKDARVTDLAGAENAHASQLHLHDTLKPFLVGALRAPQ